MSGLSCLYLQIYSSGSNVKQRGMHVIVLNQADVSTKGTTHWLGEGHCCHGEYDGGDGDFEKH